MIPAVIRFARDDREHRTLVGYVEVPDDGQKGVTSGNLYLRKSALGTEPPESLTFTVEAG
jgi:hypothetical protein